MVSYKLSGRIAGAGFQVDYDPPRDGGCFYAAAAHKLGISCAATKKWVFEHLENNRTDVSVYILYCQTFFNKKHAFNLCYKVFFFHFKTLQYIPNSQLFFVLKNSPGT